MKTVKVLMVCTGNICRSVMAQTVLEQSYEKLVQAKDPRVQELVLQVDSVGISDEERGNPPDPRALKVLAAHGWAQPEHRARQISPLDLQNFDLILAMTSGHYQSLRWLSHYSEADNKKIRYYRSFDPQASAEDLEVPDPWYGGEKEFEETIAVIERTTPALLESLF